MARSGVGGSRSWRISELRYWRGGLDFLSLSLFELESDFGFKVEVEFKFDSTPNPIGIEYLLESVLPREMGVIRERRCVYLFV